MELSWVLHCSLLWFGLSTRRETCEVQDLRWERSISPFNKERTYEEKRTPSLGSSSLRCWQREEVAACLLVLQSSTLCRSLPASTGASVFLLLIKSLVIKWWRGRLQLKLLRFFEQRTFYFSYILFSYKLNLEVYSIFIQHERWCV